MTNRETPRRLTTAVVSNAAGRYRCAAVTKLNAQTQACQLHEKVACIPMVQRSNFPNSDASDLRREFQKATATALANGKAQP